jgi:hypothetical protein
MSELAVMSSVVQRQDDITRLDIPVDDAARVRVMQRTGAGESDAQDIVQREQVALAAVGRQGPGPVDVLHDDIVVAVLHPGVVYRQDIRMLQVANHLRLCKEHLARSAGAILVFPVYLRVVDLDGHVASIERIMGQVNAAGAAFTDLVDDPVFTYLLRQFAARINH